jgi:hypothetical protein
VEGEGDGEQGARKIWLRGPSTLRCVPYLLRNDRLLHLKGKVIYQCFFIVYFELSLLKLLICLNQFCRGWREVTPDCHKRLPNGILGILCKIHWPGLVEAGDWEELAETFDHYINATDQDDGDDRNFNTKAGRVVNKLWVSLPRKTLCISMTQYIAFNLHIPKVLTTIVCAGFLQMWGGLCRKG